MLQQALTLILFIDRYLIAKISISNLIIDSNFETGGTPINKLNSSLLLELGNSSIHITRNNVTAIEQTDRHVLPVPRITFDQLNEFSPIKILWLFFQKAKPFYSNYLI